MGPVTLQEEAEITRVNAQRGRSPPTSQEERTQEKTNLLHPDFKLPVFRTTRKRISIVESSHPLVLYYGSPSGVPWGPSRTSDLSRGC